MFTPMFDGQYRSKRSVSLRGASRQGELSDSLLANARLRREERERERLRTTSAITIQSFYRGCLSRHRVNQWLRSCFDSGCGTCSSPAHLYTLSSQLLVFYRESIDHTRLVALCQKWVQMRVAVQRDLGGASKGRPYRLLCRLLVVCLGSLKHNPNQLLSGPLRMIDVFVNVESTHVQLLEYVIARGYFAMLRTLIETRLPPPDEDSPVLPLATSLLEYIDRPIKSKAKGTYEFIISEMLAPPISPHLCNLIVPTLEKSELDVPLFLRQAGAQSLVTPPSATLGYSIMRLVQYQIDTLSESSVCDLLLIINNVLKSLAQEEALRKAMATDEDFDEDEEEEDQLNREPLEYMELDPTSSPSALGSYIVEQVANGPLANTIIKYYKEPSSMLTDSLCSVCYYILSKAKGSSLFHYKLLVSLALTPPTLNKIWTSLSTMTLKRTFGPSVNVLDHFRRGSSLPHHEGNALLHKLSTFSILLHMALLSLHDIELFTKGPFTMADMSVISLKLRDVFVTLNMSILYTGAGVQSGLQQATPTSSISAEGLQAHEIQFLSNALYRLLKGLYDRNSRLGFCTISSWCTLSLDNMPVDLFYVVDEDEEEAEPRPVHSTAVCKQANLLRKTPFVFQFMHRVTFFRKLVKAARMDSQGRLQEFLIGPSISITARRSHLYDDAFSKLATEDLRKRVNVQLVNEQGLEEAGIDGGGLFREFLSETLKTAFDPNRGFFTTTKEGFLYPNPTAHLVNEDHALHYKFLGSLLGKVLLEQMLVELPFAPFFLRKLTSSERGWVDIHHLGSLDPELYHHLLWLKNYTGDFEDLGLDFTVVSNEFGQSRVIELKPNGCNVRVTANNYIEYIHSIANYHLNRKIDRQFRAFREGLKSVVPLEWLTLFNQLELQTLISGTEEPINMADLRRYTAYSGSYKEDHKSIAMFWDIVDEFTDLQKKQLLKFVTSCSRPPLLGFKELHPPFCILSASETDRLPSASTCMNLLKLPMFETRKEMKEKLVYAISSGAGFELS